MIPTTGVFDNGPLGFTATISTNQQEMNLATWATGQGWDGSSYAEITVAEGVYVWSDDTSVPAMTTGSFPNGLKLIADGYIIGKGGNGAGGAPADPILALSGGTALYLGTDIIIFGNTNGYIAGGGGGGGAASGDKIGTGGGGAGGGDAGLNGQSSDDSAYGGLPGQKGEDGVPDGEGGGGGGAGGGGSGSSFSRGGGGGRILPGIGGTGENGGGNGGSGPNPGENTPSDVNSAAGGGGWGAYGGDATYTNNTIELGAAGGKAVDLNGHTVTWEGEFDTDFPNHIYGAVS